MKRGGNAPLLHSLITSVSLACFSMKSNFMLDLRTKGESYGEIGEKVFDKYGYTLDARDIRRIIFGIESKKKEERGS